MLADADGVPAEEKSAELEALGLDRMLEFAPGRTMSTEKTVHDAKSLKEFMKDKNVITREYLDDNGIWMCNEVIASERHADGSLRSIIMTQKNINAQKKTELTSNALNAAISRTYIALYHYDLVNDLCHTIKTDDNSGYNSEQCTIPQAIEAFERGVLTPEVILENRDFWDMSTIADRLQNRDIVTREIHTRRHGWVRFDLIAYMRDENSRVTDILWTTKAIHEEKKKQLQQQEDLRKANEAAMAATRSKTTFLSNMSHDIRTPMNAIVGFAGIACAHSDDTERVKDCVKKIKSSSEHLLRLINDVLDMSHIESGKMDINEEPCVISDIIHSIVPIVQPQADSKRHTFITNVLNVENEYIIADASKISRVLINLLGNAVKYTKPGGIITFTIEEYPVRRENYTGFRFKVSDTGQGMSEDFLKRVFQPFERESNTTKSGIEGTGLGLAISKNIIDMVGGTLSVDSKLGEGTTFTVEIELRLSSKGLSEEESEKLSGLRALVIDDDEKARGRIASMLRELGLRTDEALSSAEFTIFSDLAADIGDPYKAYIIDESLPDRSAADLAARLKDSFDMKDTAVILTSYDHSKIAEEAKAAGFTDFCDKPVFMSDLKKALIGSVKTDDNEETAADRSRIKGIHLLVVDDNDLNREIDEVVLTEVGFTVETASDGKEAVDLLEQNEPGHFDLVLMDIQMPIMDGYEATKTIRELGRKDLADIPVVAMSANAFEEDKKRSSSAGMNDHISKPIDIDLTVDTILKYVKK